MNVSKCQKDLDNKFAEKRTLIDVIETNNQKIKDLENILGLSKTNQLR